MPFGLPTAWSASARLASIERERQDREPAFFDQPCGRQFFLVRFVGGETVYRVTHHQRRFRRIQYDDRLSAICPADRLLVETDAPYLAPVPLRGKRCEPSFVAHTASRLAEVRGASYRRHRATLSK